VSLVSDSFKVFAQYLLPKQALTAFAGWVASRQRGRVTTALIRWFVGKYQVNMAEAANPDIGSYLSFNDFFTRALRPGVRPLADATLICPVDGAISHYGNIEGEQIFQAKGHQYSTTALVGGDSALAAQFHGGSFATLYLSPRDYHRIHMPCDGRLQQMVYVPGDLFSVNPVTARGVPGLFARNERVVCVFETALGPMVLTLVGAVWHGVLDRHNTLRQWHYDSETAPVRLQKGEEMGRFLLGSTVVMLFPPGSMQFNPAWHAGAPVLLGQAMSAQGLP
jgi:phosphatidylserine decarboxylase